MKKSKSYKKKVKNNRNLFFVGVAGLIFSLFSIILDGGLENFLAISFFDRSVPIVFGARTLTILSISIFFIAISFLTYVKLKSRNK